MSIKRKGPCDEAQRSDAHMDIDNVREGAIVIAPVKVAGGGIKEDLPFFATEYTQDQTMKAQAIAQKFGFKIQKDTLPIQMIGSGPNLNEAVACGANRMAKILNTTPEEVKNWVTLNGGVEIARLVTEQYL